MQKIRLGQTGLMVTRVGFGGIPIQRLPESEAIKVIRKAIDLGINFIDTANAYTDSEVKIGKAIAGKRDTLVLATKSQAADFETCQDHINKSLSQLGTDYVDIFQFHQVGDDKKLGQILGPKGAMEAASKAKSEGKVGHIGFTSHILPMAVKMVKTGLFETVQVGFNFMSTEPIDELIPLTQEMDAGFIAMKPMAGGMFTDARLSFRFLAQYPTVVPIPGIEKAGEIEEIVGIVKSNYEKVEPLTQKELRAIESVKEELGKQFCHRCDYCQPCPEKIAISAVLVYMSFTKRMTNKQVLEGWVAKAVEKGKSCTECGQCEERCPYELPIRELIKENITYYEQFKQKYA